MGGQNPEYAATPVIPAAALTLAEMLVQGWALRTQCKKCGTVLKVHLPSAIAVLGAEAIPWGRTPPCQVVSDHRFPCEGRLTYLARTKPHTAWKPLHKVADRELAILRDNRIARVRHSRQGADD
ncbi:hypothetical protein [Caulobacter soli]|uniref:hypothetical protein n=1 Tax=Caulobacter soli TaxID=2708539 RepID=UPI0013EAB0DF|nr:hypothetical protein [Caulobacter soli]